MSQLVHIGLVSTVNFQNSDVTQSGHPKILSNSDSGTEFRFSVVIFTAGIVELLIYNNLELLAIKDIYISFNIFGGEHIFI